MTTDTFLAAFKRFVSRRGLPAHVYSDNGTYFIGANAAFEKEVKKMLNNSQKVYDELVLQGIQWHFAPPAAPHFGGMYESGVKSIKYHMKRIIGESVLTYEELATALYQIEACLNSRPICPLTDDAADMTALTPGHFLVGKPLLNAPDAVGTKLSLGMRWNLVQKITHDFWQRWSKDYLLKQQQRSKWQEEKRNMEIGDLVLMKDGNTPTMQWPLGRITEIHPGKDNKVRVVTVKNTKGTFKRPITKMCPLPINNSKKESTVIEKTKSSRKNKSGNIMALALMTLMCVFASGPTTQAEYHISRPKAGIYIEEIGQAQIIRGIWRLQVNIPTSSVLEDKKITEEISNGVKMACEETKKIIWFPECAEFMEHLQQKQDNIIRDINIAVNHEITRKKRGLFGTLMQSVFGVNDEVYTEIDSLSKQQKMLLQTANHQTNIILTTLATVNDTDAKINKKVKQFNIKLNTCIDSINNMKGWFKGVDQNRIKIHMLMVYQIALDYYDTIEIKYGKMIRVQLGNNGLLEFISPSKITHLIAAANDKLPMNLRIVTNVMQKSSADYNNQEIKVFGYYYIIEMTNFTLVKSTPIPIKISRGVFSAIETSTDFLAIDYNNQEYFEINDNEFTECIKDSQFTYLCKTDTVKKIDSNPNCLIDEMYNRTNKIKCPMYNIRVSNIIWKHLYTRNTWMFIAAQPTQAAVYCHGVREDITLNDTGILHVSPGCNVKTPWTTLKSSYMSGVSVSATYNKPMIFNMSNTQENMQDMATVNIEPILKPSDSFKSIIQNEVDLQREYSAMQFKEVPHHTHMILSSTTLIIVVLFVSITTIILVRRRRINNQETINEPSSAQEMMMKEIDKKARQIDFEEVESEK